MLSKVYEVKGKPDIDADELVDRIADGERLSDMSRDFIDYGRYRGLPEHAEEALRVFANSPEILSYDIHGIRVQAMNKAVIALW